MESSLSLFNETGQGMHRIQKGLLSETEFSDTLIELNIAARLKKKFPVTLQPPIGKKNVLDIESTIDGSRVLFEIFKPKGDIRLEYVETVHGIDNVICGKIVKKIDDQIKHALDSKLPVVLVIDKTDAIEIDEYQIMDTLFGATQITMIFDKEKKVVNEYPSRAKDSIYNKTTNARVISVIMLVKQDYDYTDMKIKINGKIFLAPQPLVPLDKKIKCAIEETVFGTAMF